MKGLLIIDVVNDLVKESNIDTLYSENNEYGGHFSREGNYRIATIIYNELIKNGLWVIISKISYDFIFIKVTQ